MPENTKIILSKVCGDRQLAIGRRGGLLLNPSHSDRRPMPSCGALRTVDNDDDSVINETDINIYSYPRMRIKLIRADFSILT